MKTPGLLAIAAGTLAGLYVLGKAGAAQGAEQSEPRFVSVGGHDYRVFKLGGGNYRVERLIGNVAVTRYDFGQNGPLGSSGDPQYLSELEADIQKFPSNLFQLA